MRRNLVRNSVLALLAIAGAEGCSPAIQPLTSLQERYMPRILSESIGSADSFVPNCPAEGVFPKLNADAKAILVAASGDDIFLGMPQVERLRIEGNTAFIPADLRWGRHGTDEWSFSPVGPDEIPGITASGARLIRPRDFNAVQGALYWGITRPIVDDDGKTVVSEAYHCGCTFKEGSEWKKAGERYEREVLCREKR